MRDDSLFRGNLVLECPVPTALLELCPIEHRKEQEFALMRYTAVTCGPDDFAVSDGNRRHSRMLMGCFFRNDSMRGIR